MPFHLEELKPFPGRGYAVARMVTSVVVAVIICETLRIPEPAFSAYLIFFVVNEDGVSSIKLGLLAMAGLTLALVAAVGVSICFMDAPWFRLPVTFLLIAGAVWLSRTLVLAVMGRMIAVIFVLYLSLADTIFDAEQLTEATLWLWSIVGVAVGVSALTSVVLEPRPDLLLRAQLATSLGSVQHMLETLVSGRRDRSAETKALRRQVYALAPAHATASGPMAAAHLAGTSIRRRLGTGHLHRGTAAGHNPRLWPRRKLPWPIKRPGLFWVSWRRPSAN